MLNIIGQIFDSSGYSIHTRELANALGEITECSLTTGVVPNWQRFVNDKELEMIKREQDGDINLIITNPVFWRLHTNAKRNWVYLVWEGDRIPKSWVEECLNPDIEYILVPSKHTKDAILKTLLDQYQGDNYTISDKGRDWSKIKIVPHGVDLKKFYPKEKKKERFTFLANKGFRHMQDRGGIQYLVKSYLEEFTKDDNVELILKINPVYGFDPNIMKNFKGDAKITIISDNIEYNQLINLYNQCDVFVSPSRAESFNIPCLEAMACGKPVITSDFGGQTDYCSQETGWMITGILEEVKFDLQYEGIKWLTPDIEQLKKSLRQAYELDKDYLGVLSNTARKTAELNTWENSAQIIQKLI